MLPVLLVPPATGVRAALGSVTVVTIADCGNNAVYTETVGGVETSPLLMENIRLLLLPRKTGLMPTGTMPTFVSPETSICISLPLAEGTGLVESVMPCSRAPGSPVGGGIGVINWRKVSLQPIATSKRATAHINNHNA